MLFIGVDAAVGALGDAAYRASRKPARGGLENVLLGRLSLDDAPGELVGLADSLSVLLPWGSLLDALAGADPGALARLRALGKPDTRIRVVLGYGPADLGAVAKLPALELSTALEQLERDYARAGLRVRARRLARAELRALDTTWAQKLAFSGTPRSFVELVGRTLDAPRL